MLFRSGDDVLAFERPSRLGGAGILVVCNTGMEQVTVAKAGVILVASRLPLERTASNGLVIPPDTTVWLHI